MVRVQINTSAGRRYVQVVDDYTDSEGRRRVKVLKSFGQATDVNVASAHAYAANVRAFEELITQLAVGALIIAFAALGSAALAHLLKKYGHRMDEYLL